MPPVLEVKNLSKWYGQYHAVKGISFALQKGEILGLLGPNGAGKTTTIQMLLGLTTPDEGSIYYFGKHFAEHQVESLSKINFASAYAKLQGKLTIRQSLKVHAGFYGVKNPDKKIEELAELMGITRVLDELFWHLSSGQQTRSILAKSLISEPKLLLMDEPTASLDPEIVHKIIEVIRSLRNDRGVSILFTSHNMEEVTRLCDRVMFLRSGSIDVIDTPVGLTKRIKNARLILTFDGLKKQVSEYLDKTAYQYDFLSKQVVEISTPEDQIPTVLFGFKKHQIYISHISIDKPTLEDVFLEMVKRQQEEA